LDDRARVWKKREAVDIAIEILYKCMCIEVQIGIEVAVRLGVDIRHERRDLEILGLHSPTPTSARVFEIMATDQHCVFRRLVASQVRDEPAIAECDGVSVDHEHAVRVAGERKQLAGATVGIDIAGERARRETRLAATRRAQTDGV
jgi:hypothetical protein